MMRCVNEQQAQGKGHPLGEPQTVEATEDDQEANSSSPCANVPLMIVFLPRHSRTLNLCVLATT